MGVTRARVYQLLEDCARVMDVRWPDGKTQLARLVPQIPDRSSAGRRSQAVAGDGRIVLSRQARDWSTTSRPSNWFTPDQPHGLPDGVVQRGRVVWA